MAVNISKGYKTSFLQRCLDSEQCFELQEDPIINWGVLKSCQENSAYVEHQGEDVQSHPETAESNPAILSRLEIHGNAFRVNRNHQISIQSQKLLQAVFNSS